MKKFTSFLLLCAGFSVAFAQTPQMHIHYSNGTVESKPLSEIAKITFDSTTPGTGEVDPTGQMVDLGLSVKWAAWNVGATSPEDFGNYYAYGELKPKADYTFNNYKWRVDDYVDADMGEWAQYLKLGANFTGTNYDVAHVDWGELWRMPSREEWQELFDNCTKSWTSLNGVTGARFTSKLNGNSIFIPAAGNKYNGQTDHVGYNCMLWTPEEFDEFYPDDYNNECRNFRVDISAEYSNTDGYDYPYVGFSIRPVYGEVPEENLPVITNIPTADQAVDLGLPSGTLWAPFNIGASASNERGLYFSYGELTEKLYSHKYNYKFYDPLDDAYILLEDGDIQATDYDPAHVLWGNGWMMPSEEQIRELVEECDWRSDGKGMKVIGPNDNFIYLPAADQMDYIGVRYQNDVIYPSSTVSNIKGGFIYGIAATQQLGGSVQEQPVIRTWMSIEAAHVVRPVRSK